MTAIQIWCKINTWDLGTPNPDAETSIFMHFKSQPIVLTILKWIFKTKTNDQECGQHHFATCSTNIYAEWA